MTFMYRSIFCRDMFFEKTQQPVKSNYLLKTHPYLHRYSVEVYVVDHWKYRVANTAREVRIEEDMQKRLHKI